MNRIFVLSLIQRHEPKRTLNMNWSTLVKPLIWTTFPPSLLPLAKNHYVELDPMAQTHGDIEHSGEAPNSDHFSSQPPLPPLPKDHLDPMARTHEDIEHSGEAPNSDNFSPQPPLPPLANNHYVELDPMARTHQDIEHSGEAPNSEHFSSQPTLPCLPEDHWCNDIIHTFAPNDEPTTTNDVNRDPLDDYMYFHFRFTSPPIEQSSQPSSKEWWEIHVARADQPPPARGKYKAAIPDFVMALL